MITTFILGSLTIIDILARKKLHNSIIIRFLLILKIISSNFIISMLMSIFAKRLLII